MIIIYYFIPIITFLIIDYIRAPKGITLQQLLSGEWHLSHVDRDYDDPYDSIMQYKFAVWTPFINYCAFVIGIICMLMSLFNIIKESSFWNIKIK